MARNVLLYIDASGNPHLDPQNNVYVMLGICAHEGTWFALERRFQGLKNRFQFPGIPFELHAKDFCIDIREQTEIMDFENKDWQTRREEIQEFRQNRITAEQNPSGKSRLRKKFKRTESFIHLSRRERAELYESALDLVGNHEGLRLFGEAADKRYLFIQQKISLAIDHGFTQVVTRFDAFLTNYNNSIRGVDNGILILDDEPTHKIRLHELLAQYQQHGHPWGELNHVIDTPFFVNSQLCSGVQLADVCAYAVRRYLDHGLVPGSHEERNFKRIYHKFDRAGPRLHGLRHYHNLSIVCTCLICNDRTAT